jgi:beta-dihydromenaquinone-9 omega-hydroxylase
MALNLAAINADLAVRHSRAGVARAARRLRGDVACGAQLTDFDPLDPEVLADPYPSYRALLQGPALHYNRRRALWFLCRYEDVRAGARANDELSSAESVARYRARLPMMLTVDRPEHTRLRRVVSRDFTRDAMERSREEIGRIARDAIGRMLAAGETDAVAELASPLPVAVIAHVLGVPAVDLPDFRRWSDRVVEGFGVAPGTGSLGSSLSVLGATVKLRSYFLEQFERRRRSPGPDLLSRMLASSEDGRLTEDELFWFGFMLLVAGNETTTSLLGTMLLSLARHPEEWAKLRDDPDLVPSAVEEALRHTSPIQGLYRTALSDYRVGPASIPAGGRVLLLYGAANRDPRKFPQPDDFLIERNPTDHLAFGSGIHFCLGAHLARLEGAIVLRELVERVEAIELAGEPSWNPNPSLRGLSRLPVRLVPSA